MKERQKKRETFGGQGGWIRKNILKTLLWHKYLVYILYLFHFFFFLFYHGLL